MHFALAPEELETLAEIAGQGLSSAEVVVTRDYAGNFEIQFPKDPTLFPNALHPNSIDSICQNLLRPTEEMGDNFRTVAMKCVQETTQCAREGRFEKLASIREQHVAALQEQFTEGNPEPQYSNENQFIDDYTAKLTQIETMLGEELTPYQKVHACIVSKLTQIETMLGEELTPYQKVHGCIVSELPTFIYMDDYKTFHGRADLAARGRSLFAEFRCSGSLAMRD